MGKLDKTLINIGPKDRNRQNAKKLAKRFGVERKYVLDIWTQNPYTKKSVSKKLISLGLATMVATGVYLGNCSKKKDSRLENLEQIFGVERVYPSQENKPDVIYIPFGHSSQMGAQTPIKDKTASSIESICNTLYDQFGVRNIILEGLVENQVYDYNVTGSIQLKSRNISESGVEEDNILSRLLSNRQWNLYCGDMPINQWDELDRLEEPIREIHRQYMEFVYKTAENISDGSQRISLGNHEIEIKREEFQRKIDEYISPEFLSAVHNLKILVRNDYAIQKAREISKSGPVIIIYGYQHKTDLLKKMEDVGLRSITLIPRGIPSNAVFDANIKKEYTLPIVNIN